MPPEALLEKKEADKPAAKGVSVADEEADLEVKGCALGMDGYYETARCAVEMAMTCRFDKEHLPHKGGVLTAASCGQDYYAKRLIQSGIKFQMGRWWEEHELG